MLLDEVGKNFERVITERLVGHLVRVDPNLGENQFGFRQRRSTVDAIIRTRAYLLRVMGCAGVGLSWPFLYILAVELYRGVTPVSPDSSVA